MSIAAAFGAAPSNFTMPLTAAAVAGSIGVAGAVAAAGAAAAGWSSGVSFLLHPAGNWSKHSAASMQLVIQIVLFMSCSLLRVSVFARTQTLFLSTTPRAIGRLYPGRRSTGFHCSFADPRAHTALFFGRKGENIIDEQLRVIFLVAAERCWRLPREAALAVVLLKRARGHGRAGTNRLRINDPALDPIGLQASLACRKLGAVAVRSCAGSPVAWHFKHGAA